MTKNDKLKTMYEEELGRGPFPTKDCAAAHISGAMHGNLVMFLADIAGLASRGERGLASLPNSEKARFLQLASKSFYERYPALRRRITPTNTPALDALLESTERARQLVIQILSR